MHEKRTRHALGAWVRGTGLAVSIVAVVALVGMYPRVLEWEHRWLVARCAIAYVGEDGRIHLTNEAGTLDVELDGPAYMPDTELGFPPAWSPNGELIAYTHQPDPKEYEYAVVVLEPATGRLWERAGRFGGWVRDEVVLEPRMGFVNARTGEPVEQLHQYDAIIAISPIPGERDGGWIISGSYGGGASRGVQFRDAQLNIRMPSWMSFDHGVGPRVDPKGEWAGWTWRGRAVIKPLAETAPTPPRQIAAQFSQSFFCGWTPNGDVLVNVWRKEGWGLVVLDKDGKLLRRVMTDVRPREASGASWRKSVVEAKP